MTAAPEHAASPPSSSAGPVAVRKAAEDDIPAMHRIRMAVRENRLSEPDSVRPEHYVPFLRGRGRSTTS